MDKYTECNETFYMAFTDYQNTSDSADTSAVMEALADEAVEETRRVLGGHA